MSGILVAFFLLLIMREMWQGHIDKFRCAYCGAHKGHKLPLRPRPARRLSPTAQPVPGPPADDDGEEEDPAGGVDHGRMIAPVERVIDTDARAGQGAQSGFEARRVNKRSRR